MDQLQTSDQDDFGVKISALLSSSDCQLESVETLLFVVKKEDYVMN